jgi:hypothetical protein
MADVRRPALAVCFRTNKSRRDRRPNLGLVPVHAAPPQLEAVARRSVRPAGRMSCRIGSARVSADRAWPERSGTF